MSFTSLFFKQSVQKRLDNSHWNYSVLYLEFHVEIIDVNMAIIFLTGDRKPLNFEILARE